MNPEALLFLVLTLLSIGVEAFFSMMEMACVSFNKVRLQYYVSKGNKKAIWLNALLNHPTRFFGTTLLGINAALQFGSECSRRFYSAIGLSPDWAPVSQIILVVIFAELAPLFAARSYAEHVALLGIRVLYVISIIMRPFVFLVECLFRLINFTFKQSPRKYSFLTKEELQRAIEAQIDRKSGGQEQEFDYLIESLFSTKHKIAKDFMMPIKSISMLSSKATAMDVKKEMKKRYYHYVPVYDYEKHQVVGVISPRDLLKLKHLDPIEMVMRRPWFVPMKSTLFQVIADFRSNNQEIGFVLDESGKTIGIITLDHTIAEILPETKHEMIATQSALDKTHIMIDRNFSSRDSVKGICLRYQIDLDYKEQESLESLMERHLRHPPGFGEAIIVRDFELKVVHSPLIGEKLINIRSL